jgi:hypothetical protein
MAWFRASAVGLQEQQQLLIQQQQQQQPTQPPGPQPFSLPLIRDTAPHIIPPASAAAPSPATQSGAASASSSSSAMPEGLGSVARQKEGKQEVTLAKPNPSIGTLQSRIGTVACVPPNVKFQCQGQC